MCIPVSKVTFKGKRGVLKKLLPLLGKKKKTKLSIEPIILK